MKRLLTVLALIASISAFASAQGDKDKAPAAGAQATVPFYGNAKCPVSGHDVDKTKYVQTDQGRVYYCCDDCKAKIDGDKAGFYKKAYPNVEKVANDTCPMMHKKAKPDVTAVYEGHEFHLCCKMCAKHVAAEGDRLVAMASDSKLTDVENANCVCGKPADATHFVVYKSKIVRTCCDDCLADFNKDADANLKKAEESPKMKH